MYADRLRQAPQDNRYSIFSPAHLFTTQQRQRELLQLLKQEGITSLGHGYVLDVGCGHGGVLLELLGWGAATDRVHGTDLLEERIRSAHQRLPFLALTQADAQHLPYPDGKFDLVLQYTVFSSILDEQIKQNIAREMCRVLRPQGVILWYDFWLNPLNPQTKGIRRSEIQALFPQCQVNIRRVTLAPPLARRIVRISWLAGYFLEKLKIFNTHYLGIIRFHHSPSQ